MEYHIPSYYCFEASGEQYEAATKIARDLDRYERSRKKAARIISAQKKELCEMAKDLQLYKKCEKEARDECMRLYDMRDYLFEQIEDLEARNTGEQETINTLHDENNRLKGRVDGVGWAFEELVKYQ